MSIRAKTSITLSVEKVITEIRNYYKKTSTNVAPSLPTTPNTIISNWTNAGWLVSEPPFDLSYQYVWVCTQTIFGEYNAQTNPNNYINSSVTLSSSYSAAIQANLVVNAVDARTASIQFLPTSIIDSEDSSTINAGFYAFSTDSVDISRQSTYKYNSYYGSSGLYLRYNKVNLADFLADGVHLYYPKVEIEEGQAVVKQGSKSIQLTTAGLSLFSSSDSSNAAATLTTSGLTIDNGSINLGHSEVAKDESGNIIYDEHGNEVYTYRGVVQLSNIDIPNRPINGTTFTNLRLAIGDNFGVTNEGVLYANGAMISNLNADSIIAGTITVEKLDAKIASSLERVNILDSEINGEYSYEYIDELHFYFKDEQGYYYIDDSDPEDPVKVYLVSPIIQTVYKTSDNNYYYVVDDTNNSVDQIYLVKDESGTDFIKTLISEGIQQYVDSIESYNIPMIPVLEQSSLVIQNYANINNNSLSLYNQPYINAETQEEVENITEIKLNASTIELNPGGSTAMVLRKENEQPIAFIGYSEQTFIIMKDENDISHFRWIMQPNGHLSLKAI